MSYSSRLVAHLCTLYCSYEQIHRSQKAACMSKTLDHRPDHSCRVDEKSEGLQWSLLLWSVIINKVNNDLNYSHSASYFIISGFKWDILKSRNISNVFAESEFPCESAESVNALFKAHCSHSKYFPLIFKDFESEEGLLLCKQNKNIQSNSYEWKF